MKCSVCPYLETSTTCQIKCEERSDSSKKVKKPYRMPKVSKKRQIEDLQYQVLRTEFLGKKENQICPIMKTQATTIHHKKGRIGKLYLDTTFWIALSMEGHELVEKNPEWAKENGYSLDRLAND